MTTKNKRNNLLTKFTSLYVWWIIQVWVAKSQDPQHRFRTELRQIIIANWGEL